MNSGDLVHGKVTTANSTVFYISKLLRAGGKFFITTKTEMITM